MKVTIKTDCLVPLCMSGELEATCEECADENSVEHEVEGEFEVCGACEGHGSRLCEGMRGHAYSQEEFEEVFWEDEDREHYFKRGGKYDVTCEDCGGKRVTAVPSLDKLSPEIRAAYEARERREDEWARERAAELRYGY